MSLLSFVQRAVKDVKTAPQVVQRNVYQPVAHTVQVAPQVINRNVAMPVQHVAVAPLIHALGNVEHAAGNTVNALSTHNINRVANSNLSPSHLVEQYAVKPGLELGAGMGQNIYNHGVAPAFNLPKQNLTNAFSQSAEAQRIAHLTPGQQVANAIQLGSNALPGGGKVVENLAAKAGAGVAGKLGENLAGKVAGKVAQTSVRVGGNAAIGGGMGYGIGAGSTLAQGGSLKQANQAGLSNAKIGAILGGGGTVAADVLPHAIQGAKTANAMAHNYGLKPPTNLTPAELSATNKALNGNPMQLTEQDNKLFHQAQSKLVPPDQVGTAHGVNAASDALNAHTAYNTAVAQRAAQVQAVKQNLLHPTPLNEGGYIQLPGGLKKLSQQEMIAQGADGHLQHAVKANIPLSKIDGREPTPAMEGGYKKGTPIKQPIETVYDPNQDKYMLYAGNHRVTQAELNGQTHIPAFVQPETGNYKDLKTSDFASSSTANPARTGAHSPKPTVMSNAVAAAKKMVTSLDQSGKALVSEDGSVIPTVKKALGKGQSKAAAPEVAATPELNRSGSSTGSVAEKVPPITQNSLSAKARAGKQNISPETAAQVSGEGFVRNTKQLQDTAVKNANKQGLNKTIQSAHEALAVKPGQIDDATVAHVQQAIERADAVGRTQDAVGLHDALSEHLRKQGQTIQAASLLYKLSPNGLFYKASRDLKKAGTSLTPEMETKLKGLTNDIKGAKTAASKQKATATFHKFVADNIPKGKAQNALSVWKAGLLSGPLTQAGNFASNATFAGLHGASNPLAVGIDKGISLFTKQRTKTLTARGTLSGTKQGFGTGLDTMKTGIDVRNIEGNKYEIHGELNFKNPVIQNVFGKTSNLVFRGMSAADQPFYYSALKNNLADLAKADGINQGLKGNALRQHMTKVINNPTTKMAETAKLAAQKSVLSEDSKFASAVSTFANSHPALQAVVPFVKVPTNFLTRTVDFTPVGMGKGVYSAIKDVRAGKSLDQRSLSEALAEGATGTGLIVLGAHLANSNLLSGQYPSNDPKEVQRWKAEGIQPNSVKVGGKWINLNYLGPAGLLLGAGKDYQNAVAKGDNGAIQALEGLGKGLSGQSFLTGFSGAANAINDPGRYGANFVHSQAASVVPAWLNAVGNATDSKQRQADSTAASVQARIPGARNNLPVKNDVYGNPLAQRTNPLDLTVDPLKPSNDLSKKNPVVSEVNRLHSVDPNNTDLQVTPTPVTSLKVDGNTVKLNGKQKYDLQNQVGQSIQNGWSKLIQTPEYKALSDVDKAKALSNLRSDASTLAERNYVVNNNLGTYAKSPSRAVQALGQNQANLADYATNTGNSGATNVSIAKTLDAPSKQFLTKYNAMSSDDRTKAASTQNDFDYKYQQAKYNNDKASGKLTAAQDIKAQDSLAKAKVGANWSKNVRDLYGLSKSNLYTYLTTNDGKTDKASLGNQLIAYDKALHDAGLTSSLKFKYGFGSKTASGGKAAKSRSGGKFKTVSIPGIKNNPYKTASSKQQFKQKALPKFSKGKQATFKTAGISPDINAKLRKALV